MAKKFRDLRARMSPERRKRAHEVNPPTAQPPLH